MKRHVEDIFSSYTVLNPAASLFGVDVSSLKKLAGFENFIYGGLIDQKEVVLRFCHSSHRTQDEILAELDWVDFLMNRGASVCGPIPSTNQLLVEEIIVADSSFFVSAFEKAKGAPVKTSEVDLKLYYRWGKATGELHRLTQSYQPSSSITPRQDYLEMSSNQFANVLSDNIQLQQRVNSVIEQVASLEKTKDNYMLCHTDLHSGNFFYDGEQLWIFDFDDCSYHFIAHDIAMPLYYCLWRYQGSPEQKQTFAETFFVHYLSGYLSENPISLRDLETVALFLKLRDCDLCGVLRREWGVDLNENQKELVNSIDQRILSNQPIVALDYSRIYFQAQGLVEEYGE